MSVELIRETKQVGCVQKARLINNNEELTMPFPFLTLTPF